MSFLYGFVFGFIACLVCWYIVDTNDNCQHEYSEWGEPYDTIYFTGWEGTRRQDARCVKCNAVKYRDL